MIQTLTKAAAAFCAVCILLGLSATPWGATKAGRATLAIAAAAPLGWAVGRKALGPTHG